MLTTTLDENKKVMSTVHLERYEMNVLLIILYYSTIDISCLQNSAQ